MYSNALPTLDAHAHFNPSRTSDELEGAGTVLAMTLSLNEAAQVVNRQEPQIVWGVGCHPRKPKSQNSFSIEKFQELAERTAVIGEIGLDTGSRVRLETQLRTFRQILETLAKLPRIISIHSYRANGLVINELQRNPVTVPILHWWTGNLEETRQAVALGCYFSVHSAVARHSKFRTTVPRERLLVESDHGWADPPAAIPCRIQWVEYLLAAQLKLNASDVRLLVWQNFASIVHKTETINLFPQPLATLIKRLSENRYVPIYRGYRGSRALHARKPHSTHINKDRARPMNNNKRNHYHTELMSAVKKQAKPLSETQKQKLANYIGTKKIYYAISTETHRKIIRDWIKHHPNLNEKQYTDLLTSLYEGQSVNEISIAGSLLRRCPKLRRTIKPEHIDVWLNRLEGWAEVDSLCQSNFSAEEALTQWDEWQRLLTELASNDNVHKKRASLVLLTKPVRDSEDPRLAEMAFKNIDKLKQNGHILVTKAISWLLRDLIKHHRQKVETYLKDNENTLPRIAIRETRTKLLTGKKTPTRLNKRTEQANQSAF